MARSRLRRGRRFRVHGFGEVPPVHPFREIGRALEDSALPETFKILIDFGPSIS